MFDKFKANHGGNGPFAEVALNSKKLGGPGFGALIGVKKARSMLDSIIESQQGDASLAESMAPVWDQLKRAHMTRPMLEQSAAMLIQRGDDIKQAGKSFADFGELQSRYRSAAAGNAQDLSILDSIDTQGKIAHDKIISSNPKIQEEGRALSGQVFAAQREYATKNEEQSIAKNAQNEAGIRAMGEQSWTRYQATRDDLSKESAPFLVQRQAIGTAKALLQSNSEASDYGLLYSWNKMLDPNSSVREGEFANAQNLAGVPDIIVTALNTLRGGQRLTPEKRADIYKQMADIYKQGVSEQTERNGRFAGQARAFDVPDEAISAMMIPVQSPGNDPTFNGSAPDGTAAPGQRGATGAWDAPSTEPTAYERLAAALGNKPYYDSLPGETGPQTRARRAEEAKPKPSPYPRKGIIQRNTDEFK